MCGIGKDSWKKSFNRARNTEAKSGLREDGHCVCVGCFKSEVTERPGAKF